MKFLDLFAGIGGFRMALENAGHECVGFVEIERHARASYKAIYETKGESEYHDITQISDKEWRKYRGTVDLICAGFPCQPFSSSGKKLGFEDTRGTLFFEIARAAKQIKPRLLLLENVKGLLHHGGGETFGTILKTLDEIGYDAEWELLNSKDFGVPQNRERVFIIGHLRGKSKRKIFPETAPGQITDAKIEFKINSRKLGAHSSHNVLKKDGLSTTIRAKGEILHLFDDRQEIVRAILEPSRGIKKQNGRIIKNQGEPHFTVLAQSVNGLLIEKNQHKLFRRLTPRECWRLQGFPDWAFDKAAEVNSDAQLYKQAGNSVTVPVIDYIAKQINQSLEF